MQQNKKFWLSVSDRIKNGYHLAQWENPYQSTISFFDWFQSLEIIPQDTKASFLDVATGAGANLHYMKKIYKQAKYVGIDINEDLLAMGNEQFKDRNISGVSLEYGDIYNLESKHKGVYDGVTMFQTLLTFTDYELILKILSDLDSRFLAFTSLFYDGKMNCITQVEDYSQDIDGEPYKVTYATYSIDIIKKKLQEYGFKDFYYKPFEIEIDLEKPSHGGIGTYTRKTETGERLQFSGPISMNWYFFVAVR